MPYPFLGNAPRTYPAYLDTVTDCTLSVEPGGAYQMAPAAGRVGLPVPPGDGLWGAQIDTEDEAAVPPAAAKTTSRSSKAAPAADQGE